MHKESLSEEQKQVKEILKRWWKTAQLLDAILKGAVVVAVFMIAYATFAGLWGLAMLSITGVTLLGFYFCGGGIGYQKILNRFAHRLSIEEKNVLQKLVSDETAEGYNVAKSLLAASKKELLRPSQPTQDDQTLLRAAASTDTTPQEQLLRPVPNEKS